MAQTGALDHIDISVADPNRSIPFYQVFFTALGYRRWRFDDQPEFCGERPRRACWMLRLHGGGWLGVEARPARPEFAQRRYQRYAPGPHHLAFKAADRGVVDQLHARLLEIGADVLDAPADHGGQAGYPDGYYALFVADPDGLKLEVVHLPLTNPD